MRHILLLGEAHLGAEVLGAEHLVLVLPVRRPGPQQALCQAEPRLRAGRVGAVTWEYVKFRGECIRGDKFSES